MGDGGGTDQGSDPSAPAVTSASTVAEIKDFAAEHGIDLGKARTKAQMLDVIKGSE